MLNRPGRNTHSDRLGEDEAQKALHPQNPAGEAINSNHRTGARRVKDLRQTPTDGRGPRTKDLRQTSSFRPVLLAESYVKSAVAAIPSWETFQRANHPSGLTRATGIAPPGFYGLETLVESQTVQTLLPHQSPDVKAFGQSAPTSFTKLHGSSLEDGAVTRRPISTRVGGTACSETHAFSALSACRRALSSAS